MMGSISLGVHQGTTPTSAKDGCPRVFGYQQN